MDTKTQARTNEYIQELKYLKEEIEDIKLQIEVWTHSLIGNDWSKINTQICKNKLEKLELDKKLLIEKKVKLLSIISESTS